MGVFIALVTSMGGGGDCAGCDDGGGDVGGESCGGGGDYFDEQTLLPLSRLSPSKELEDLNLL